MEGEIDPVTGSGALPVCIAIVSKFFFLSFFIPVYILGLGIAVAFYILSVSFLRLVIVQISFHSFLSFYLQR